MFRERDRREGSEKGEIEKTRIEVRGLTDLASIHVRVPSRDIAPWRDKRVAAKLPLIMISTRLVCFLY
jgi:hypothetical protein